MTENQENSNNSNNQKDIKNTLKPLKEEEEKKKNLLIEEKQPQEQLPVGEGHETEVAEENRSWGHKELRVFKRCKIRAVFHPCVFLQLKWLFEWSDL